LLREARKGDIANGILAAVKAGLEVAPENAPKVDNTREKLQVNPAIADLLRVLLKARAESKGVAQKLIATSAELAAIAAGERDLPALKGWRREVFGEDALELCAGRIGLATKGTNVVTIRL
jgi:ribonuclease D